MKVYFKILQDVILPFKYGIKKGNIFQAESDQPGIETADQNELIEVIEWNVSEDQAKKYIGSPEPVYDNGFKFVEISEDGLEFIIKPFGEWKCVRCDHLNFVEVNGSLKEPFECQNDTCGRKGPFKPQFPKDLIKPIWKLPNAPMTSTSGELFNDVKSYLKDHLVLNDEEYDLMALWLMASWLVDDFNTAPYLLFIAPKSSGKTQGLNMVAELGYRSFLTVSVTAAAIFRAVDLWHITPLIDEAEFQVNTDKPTESSSALYGLLNGGYKRGNHALRIEGENRVPTAFDIFGFKAIASTKVFLPTLESRSIIINMAQGVPEKILIDENRSQILRSKLLYWRYSHLRKLPLVIPNSKSGRLTEIFIPLFTVSQTLKDISDYNKVTDILNKKMADMEHERQEEEKSTAEAQIIQAIVDIENTDGVNTVSIKGITKELNWVEENDKKEFRKASQRVGYLIRAMGLKTRKDRDGMVIDFIDDQTINKLEELKQRFLRA